MIDRFIHTKAQLGYGAKSKIFSINNSTRQLKTEQKIIRSRTKFHYFYFVDDN